MTYERWRYLLVILLTIIAGVYLIGETYHAALSFAGILFLYFTAWLISFMLSPLVDWLCAHRFPRLLAVTYVYLVLAAVIVILVLALVPTVLAEAARLTDPRQLAEYGRVLTHRAQDMQAFLVQHTPLPRANIARLVDQWNNQVVTQVQQINNNLVNLSGSIAGTTVSVSINIVQASLNWLLNAVIILVLSFYMTIDGKRLMASMIAYLPSSWADEVAAINASIERSFGGYIRGQVVIGLLYGLMTWVTLSWFHVVFAVALAVFAGVMMLIPFIGTFLAVIPPLVVAGLQGPGGSSVLWLAIALIVWQQVTLQVLAPRILGNSVGMHPLLVFLGVLLGAKLAGPWGAIFGVPVLGVCLTVAGMIYRLLQAHRQLTAGMPEQPPLATAEPTTVAPTAVAAPPLPGPDEQRPKEAVRAGGALGYLIALGVRQAQRHLPGLVEWLNALGQHLPPRRRPRY